MKARGPRPLRLLAYFVLCLTGWMMVRPEIGPGAPLDVFWLAAFPVLVLMFWGSLWGRPRESSEVSESDTSQPGLLQPTPTRASAR